MYDFISGSCKHILVDCAIIHVIPNPPIRTPSDVTLTWCGVVMVYTHGLTVDGLLTHSTIPSSFLRGTCPWYDRTSSTGAVSAGSFRACCQVSAGWLIHEHWRQVKGFQTEKSWQKALSIQCNLFWETTAMRDHLSWQTTHFWQKDLHFSISEPVTRDHRSWWTTFLWQKGWSSKGGSTVQENLYIKTTLGTDKIWSLYTGGLYISFSNMGRISLGTCKFWSS